MPENDRESSASEIVLDKPQGNNILLWLQVHLRGRYLILFVLSAVIGGGLGFYGYRMGEPTYRAAAQIQVLRPQTILYRLDDASGGGDDSDGYLAAQVGLLKSQRVVEWAMQNPDWQAIKPGSSQASIEKFLQATTVTARDRLINVFFDDPDARVATAGVKSVVAAYKQLYVEQDTQQNTRRLELLQQRETSLSNEESGLRVRIESVANKYGTDDLKPLYEGTRAGAQRMAELLSELKMRQALTPANPNATTRPAEEAKEWEALLDKLEVEELAQKDALLHDLLAERTAVEREIKKQTLVHGYGDTHPAVQTNRKRLSELDSEIAQRVPQVRETLKRFRPTVNGGNLAMDAAELQKKVLLLSQLADTANKEALALGQESLKLRGLQEDREAVKAKLAETRKRIEQLTVESMSGNRVQILAEGWVGSTPSSDTRPRFAAMGAVGGILISLGFVLLPSLVSRRFRASEETRIHSMLGPTIGILPQLPEGLDDEEGASIAAHCVHQTRTMLQIRHDGEGAQVLAVTSSLAGTGKTSLTLALGVSYATAGSRALLVDCDLVGGGLSARVKRMNRRRLGTMLMNEGLITSEQLENALSHAVRKGCRLGEACVQLEYLSSEAVNEALEKQEGAHLGILDALKGEPLEHCVADSGFPGLQVLPLGLATSRDCASISPAALKQLIKQSRSRFDVVIFDTGPVPGSLEASSIIPHMDGLIMVVSRGESRSMVSRSVEFLRGTGAALLGVVFNRAMVSEIQASSGTLRRSSNAFRSSSGIGLRVDTTLSRSGERLGPMAQAVVGCGPTKQEEEQ